MKSKKFVLTTLALGLLIGSSLFPTKTYAFSSDDYGFASDFWSNWFGTPWAWVQMAEGYKYYYGNAYGMTRYDGSGYYIDGTCNVWWGSSGTVLSNGGCK